jgi:hypothetical protein
MPQERPYPEQSYSDKSYPSLVSYLTSPRWANVEMMFPKTYKAPSPPEFVVEDKRPRGEKPE